MLGHLTRLAGLDRRQASAIIFALLLFIGVADYASGIHVSLSVFYFVPILLAVAWLGWQAAIGAMLASVAIRIAGDFLANGAQPLPLWSWWNSASTLIVFLVVAWIFANLLASYRQLEERVTERTAELLKASEHRRLLQHELLEVSSNERNRMGQELHDDICQHLVATALAAKVLAQRLARQQNELGHEAEAIIGLMEEGIAKTRQLARGLLLSAIEPSRLAEKLSELVDEGSRSGVPCRFVQAGDVLVADSGVAAQLYRIAQEAMRNAVRHADATRVDVSLVGDRHAICLIVEDDGRGLPEPKPGAGMGLQIMAHRAAYIGATLSWIATLGQGTRILCHLAVDAPRS